MKKQYQSNQNKQQFTSSYENKEATEVVEETVAENDTVEELVKEEIISEEVTEEVKASPIIADNDDHKIAELEAEIKKLEALMDRTHNELSKCQYYDQIIALKKEIDSIQHPPKPMGSVKITVENNNKSDKPYNNGGLVRGQVFGNNDILVNI